MPISIRLQQTMVEIWARKGEPQTSDLQRALHAARVLEADSSSPLHLRSFAWHLVVETHHAVGWDLPTDVSFPTCRAAAASLKHASSLLMNDIAEQLHDIDSPILVLGALAASRSVFGRWDTMPASGALLVPLDAELNTGQPDGTDLPEIHSIRWASPGRFRQIYEEHVAPADLGGASVLIPKAELVAARNSYRHLHNDDPGTLLFCGAALEASAHGRWSEVNQLARMLGHHKAPLELAVSLGIDQRLGLEISRPFRIALAVRRFLHRRTAG